MTVVSRVKSEDLRKRQSLLIETNVVWLCQARELLDEVSDSAYTASPPSIAPHRVGGHLRHILEFYECFLDGLEGSHVDYDARRRDVAIERNRHAALGKIDSIIQRLRTEHILLADDIIWVRVEDASALQVNEAFMISSTGRELQTLSSHTIHHFALIAITLRALGHEVDKDFGVAPSTLRYRSSRVLTGVPAEAA
jgi:uncharacterized damage-inducible protein DinB